TIDRFSASAGDVEEADSRAISIYASKRIQANLEEYLRVGHVQPNGGSASIEASRTNWVGRAK
ncbi:hypothetical protein ACC695_39560, partial [Rhizobium ruizarguesonis]